MSNLIAGLAGAGSAANTTGGYYQNALNNEINAAGSPAAADFARLQAAQLRPEFAQQDQQVASQAAATGLVGSGQGRSLSGNVASGQASTLAGVTAPLYQEALQGYNNINAQMPGAQVQSYNDAIQQFYQALSGAGQAIGGVPPNFGSAPNNGGSYAANPANASSYDNGGYYGSTEQQSSPY
jgi:hypothetical protein